MPLRYQHMGDTHRVWVWVWYPGRLWELPQLQAITRTLRESPHNTCAQQPANPICLPDKPLHILSRKDFRTTAKHTPLSIVPASCCHHKATWDGWRWGPTTEQIWHFLMDMQAVQDTQAKAGQEATQGTTAGVSDTSSHCVLIPPCQLHSLHGLLWMLHQVHSGVKV